MKDNYENQWTNPGLRDLLVQEGQWMGIDLTSGQIGQLLSFGRELARNNRRFNLSAIVEPTEVIRKHIIDSLAAIPLLPRKDGKLVDIGSGAGFPGLALKIACPKLPVTLVESIKKKAAFLIQTAALLAIAGVTVSDCRAEELGQDAGFRGQYQLATARAVAPLAVLLELALPLLEVGGFFIAYK
ncbi:MAG TPA: 16S rRNA (guanine(527)-N(7))-methyltransferase RsmG, partial [bacterium]|nr:16S rRNA (guanine(527)-N(7))-methyltransferase RsmG [bacterium]